MKISQCMKILEYMRKHGSITPREAEDAFGCMRLAARIADLKDQGYIIERRTKTGKNRYGNTVSFAEYYLIEEDNNA